MIPWSALPTRTLQGFASLMAFGLCSLASGNDTPNIVFIFADDWGRIASAYAELDPGGPSDIVSTPNFFSQWASATSRRRQNYYIRGQNVALLSNATAVSGPDGRASFTALGLIAASVVVIIHQVGESAKSNETVPWASGYQASTVLVKAHLPSTWVLRLTTA